MCIYIYIYIYNVYIYIYIYTYGERERESEREREMWPLGPRPIGSQSFRIGYFRLTSHEVPPLRATSPPKHAFPDVADPETGGRIDPV